MANYLSEADNRIGAALQRLEVPDEGNLAAALLLLADARSLLKRACGPAQSQAMALMVSQASVEWYTPPWVLDEARKVLGSIDLDPASNPTANAWVQAKTFYTRADDGFMKPWAGRLWLNPPFDETERWARRLEAAYVDGDVTAALLLVNSAPGYNWYERLVDVWPAIQFRKRMAFVRGDGLVNKDKGGLAKKSQTVVYFGRDVARFEAVFGAFGRRLHNPEPQPVGVFQ
jgi:hypothetical protein